MTRPRRLAALLATTVAAALVAVPAAPAHAVPAPSDDTFLVYAGASYTLDPLENDSTFPLPGGELTLCGLRGGDPQRVYTAIEDDLLVVEAVEGFRGSVELEYDACQGDSRGTATIVLEVDALADLRATRKRGARGFTLPGKVLVRNPNPVAVRVSWGDATTARADGTKLVGPGRTVTVSTQRRSLYWVGLHLDGDVVVVVGDGVLRRLRSRVR